MDVPTLEPAKQQTFGPQIRLLLCYQCNTIDELPDYEGDPRDDHLLQVVIDRQHTDRLTGLTHPGRLGKVEVKVWSNPEAKAKAMKQLREGAPGLSSADAAFYDTRSTFHDDAMACYAKHLRPKGRCPDWKIDSKKLIPDTAAERKEAGLAKPGKSGAAVTYLCDFPFRGDTEVVTRDGIKHIDEIANKPVDLLVPVRDAHGTYKSSRGQFATHEVNYAGEQPIWKVTLGRGPSRKEIYTTAEHRWFLETGPWETRTADLVAGDRLQPLKATGARGRETPVPFGIAQGFVFGDGSYGHDDRRPAKVTFYAEKDKALLPYFSTCAIKDVHVNGMDTVQAVSLPRFWKALPSLDDSRSFLLSWLAGYFAADGTVDARGSASLSSSRRDDLEFVRSLAAICGVGTSPIQSKSRVGFGVRSMLFNLTLNARDLPDWFWIIEAHKTRALARQTTPRTDRVWKVISVEDTGEIDAVYCAYVEGIGAFGLADDIMTGNCPAKAYMLTKGREEAGLYD